MATITEIAEPDFNDLVEMACDLWPDDDPAEMPGIMRGVLADKRNKNFIYKTDSGESVGFINLSIRSDYVEGSNTSPVVFIEGIYVKQAYRKLGVARQMVKKGEEWGKEMGCSEMGSDAYASNIASRNFHKGLGFQESAPLVVFVKSIRSK